MPPRILLVLPPDARLALDDILDLHLLERHPDGGLVGVGGLAGLLHLLEHHIDEVPGDVVPAAPERAEGLEDLAPLLLFLLARRRGRARLRQRGVAQLVLGALAPRAALVLGIVLDNLDGSRFAVTGRHGGYTEQ